MSRAILKPITSLNSASKNPVVKSNSNTDFPKEGYLMSFGKNLARFRKEKDLTQEDLVKRSGVAISQIRRYEADNSSPTLDVVTRLAKSLGVSIDELVFDKDRGIPASKLMDRELLEQFELVATLDADEIQAVKKILEGVIVKHEVEKMMRPKAEKSWSQRFREITDRIAKGAKEYSQEEIDKVIDEAVATVRAKEHAHI